MKIQLSVKEYAEREGISPQAVYKRLQAGLVESAERVENGKTVKTILLEVPDPAPDATEATEPRSESSIDTRTLDILEAQLKVKDEQIAALNAQIAALTELLHNSQQLQAHTQVLLQDKNETPAPENEVITESSEREEIEPQPEQKGILTWLKRIFAE